MRYEQMAAKVSVIARSYRVSLPWPAPEELATLKVGDLQVRRGVPHLKIHGKGEKTRYVPTHPQALDRIA